MSRMEVSDELRQEVAQVLKTCHLTQQAFGELAGITGSAVGKIVRGTHKTLRRRTYAGVLKALEELKKVDQDDPIYTPIMDTLIAPICQPGGWQGGGLPPTDPEVQHQLLEQAWAQVPLRHRALAVSLLQALAEGSAIRGVLA